MEVRFIHYTTERIPNPNLRGETPSHEFEKVRHDLLSTCRRFGTTGPDGLPENPKYFVIDDPYNDELYQYIEVLDTSAFSREWLEAVMQTLRRNRGWGAGVTNIKGGYLLISGDRLMVTGPPFQKCENLTSVIDAAGRNLSVSDGE